jgi:hypothetical protein
VIAASIWGAVERGLERAGDAGYMPGADGRNRYNGKGRYSGKGVVYISSERVGVRLIRAGVMDASVMAAREVISCRLVANTALYRGFGV